MAGGSKERRPPAARAGEIRRRECEEFAPRNGAIRASGEQRAGSAGRRSERRKAAVIKKSADHLKSTFAEMLC